MFFMEACEVCWRFMNGKCPGFTLVLHYICGASFDSGTGALCFCICCLQILENLSTACDHRCFAVFFVPTALCLSSVADGRQADVCVCVCVCAA